MEAMLIIWLLATNGNVGLATTVTTIPQLNMQACEVAKAHIPSELEATMGNGRKNEIKAMCVPAGIHLKIKERW